MRKLFFFIVLFISSVAYSQTKSSTNKGDSKNKTNSTNSVLKSQNEKGKITEESQVEELEIKNNSNNKNKKNTSQNTNNDSVNTNNTSKTTVQKTKSDNLQKGQSPKKNPNPPKPQSNSFSIYIILFLSWGLFIFLFYMLMKKIKSQKIIKQKIKENLKENIRSYKKMIDSLNQFIHQQFQQKQNGEFSLNSTLSEKSEEEFKTINEIVAALDSEFKSMTKNVTNFENELKEKNNLVISSTNKVIDTNINEKNKDEINLNSLLTQIENLKKEVNLRLPSIQIPKDIYINSNVLVTAGPRKDKNRDTELGEDSCGIYNLPEGTFFWILDGTSDSKIIETKEKIIFSSRLLAQQISYFIYDIVSKHNFDTTDNNKTLKEILVRALESTEKAFLNELNNISNEVKESILDDVGNNNFPVCSTTVLLGFLDKNGTLRYFYLGDSNLNSFKITNESVSPLEKDNNENPSRLFLSLTYVNNNFQIQQNGYLNKINIPTVKSNVDYLVAYSDGIGVSEKALSINPKLMLSKISLINQKTFDDKSLISLERKISGK
jgi:hypothetical protein